MAAVRDTCCAIDLLQVRIRPEHAFDWELRVFIATDHNDWFWREQSHYVGVFCEREKARDVVVGAVVNRHDRVAEGAEVAGRHGVGNAREERGGKDADGASAGVAHDADARPIDVVAGFEEVETAVDIEDALSD